MDTILIENFLDEQYSPAAHYQSYRSIASAIDGLKPSSRKVVHTIKKRHVVKDTKVSRLASDVASETQYIHGEVSLTGVICNMAQDFTGSNNDNLLYPSGSFGNRFIPQPAAPRYIYTRKSESFDYYFNKEDDPILVSQEFEGESIEPLFFVPVLPLILVNGSEGIGTGFAQKILPRSRATIASYISSYLKGETKKKFDPPPSFKGFLGTVEKEDTSWVISGELSVKNKTTIEITEVPVGYTLSSYTKVLSDLKEKKVIKDFEDISEEDQFKFIVNCTREFTDTSIEDLKDIFKLRKRVTENYTAIGRNNEIIEFSNVKEIIDYFIEIRLEYYRKRKEHLLEVYSEEASLLRSKAEFVQAVIDGSIVVSNRSKLEIVSNIDSHPYPFVKVGDTDFYSYLLSMPIYSLSSSKFQELKNKVKEMETKIDFLKESSVESIWEEDLKTY